MERIFIGIGANLKPEENILQGLSRLKRELKITRISAIFKTEPVGMQGAPYFLNGVLEAFTASPPWEVKHTLLRPIETALGRLRAVNKYSSRPLDLDLLWYGSQVVREQGLFLPDPDIPRRWFLWYPLLELDPGLVWLATGLPLAQMDKTAVPKQPVIMEEYTRQLHSALGVAKDL